MPHVIVGMLPGRTPERKKALARKIRDMVAEELGVDRMIVSVSVEDVTMENWNEFMARVPDDSILIPEENDDDEKFKKCSCHCC